MYLYMQSIFSDTGVNRHVSLKTKRSIKTEIYKVKINICAHYLKVTFGFQKTQMKKYNSIIDTITNTNNKQEKKCFERIFMQQRQL